MSRLNSTQLNFAKCLQILKIVSLYSKLNNKSVVIRLLNNPAHLKRVATLPCDLLLIMMHASDFRWFSDVDVSQGSVATVLSHIYYRIRQ